MGGQFVKITLRSGIAGVIRTMHDTYGVRLELEVFTYIQERMGSRAPVAHTCHPNYSGGRDEEDCGLKPALGK
jgi:hypothetical protein